MTLLWEDDTLPPEEPLGILGWILLVIRVLLILAFFVIGVIFTLIIRIAERPIHGTSRPWTSYITQTVFRLSLYVIGIGFKVTGTPMVQHGAVVANHCSWLDIFALNAAMRIFFVSKAEVAKWPGIGFLASLVGTIYIKRDPRQARAHNEMFKMRLLSGHKLVFFPEGTSTDGMRVIPFKSTLFQSFMTSELKDHLYIQPVTVVYYAHPRTDPRRYGWWGDMDFASHFLQILAARHQGSVHLLFQDPVAVKDFDNRKDLALHLEGMVRSGMPKDRQICT